MATQKGWKIDINQCTGCRACETACKVEFNLHGYQGRRRRVVENTMVEGNKVRTFFTSAACNHCVEPACLKACPQGPYTVNADGSITQGAYTKDVNGNLTSLATKGVVLHDPTVCIGCRRCEWACPYGAPQYNATTAKVHKCEACWQRVKNTTLHSSRQEPACSATCIGRVLKWVDVNTDAVTEVSIDGVSVSYYRAGAGSANPGDDAGDAYGNRGSKYVASHQLTIPALKVKNRVYKTRTGGVE